MNDYRPLTSEEIEVLRSNDCWAEDWTSINVSEDFKPNFMQRHGFLLEKLQEKSLWRI